MKLFQVKLLTSLPRIIIRRAQDGIINKKAKGIGKRVDQKEQAKYMARFQAGEEQGFLVLYHAYKKPLYFYLLNLLKAPDEAEEVVHDTFIKIYTQKDRFDSSYSFTTWAWTIARNAAFDILRKKDPIKYSYGLDESYEELPFSNELSLEELLDDSLKREYLAQEIKNLPLPQREIVSLRLYSEMELKEISTIMDIKLSTIKSLFYRAQKLLVEKLGEQKHQEVI